MPKRATQTIMGDWSTPRLKGKTIVIAGRLSISENDKLVDRIKGEGGAVGRTVTARTSAVLVARSAGSAAVVKQANLLNKKGASIEIWDMPAFDAFFAVTAEQARGMLSGGARGLERWRTLCKFRGPQPIDLSGIDLSHQDLHGILLHNVILSGADLRGADLSEALLPPLNGARLDGAKLKGAVLEAVDCTLRGCDLTGARVHGPSFTGCDLTDAVLTGAHLDEVTFDRATLGNTDFAQVRWNDRSTARGSNLGGLSFTAADLSEIDLSGASLANAKLTKADLTGSKLTDAVFSGADLQGTSLSEADLANANLRGCDLRGANLKSAKFTGADLRDADLRGADLSDADLTNAVVGGADFADTTIDGIRLDGVDTTSAKNLRAVADEPAGPCVTELSHAISRFKGGVFFHADIDIPTGCAAVDINAEPNGDARVVYKLFAEDEVSRVAGSGSTIAECMCRAAHRFKDGWLRMDEFRVKAGRGEPVPIGKLTELVVAAWCETVGTDPATATAAQPAKLAAYRDRWIERLKTDPKAAKAWNDADAVETWRCGTFAGSDFSEAKLSGISFYKLLFTGAKFDRSKLVGMFHECDLKKASFVGATLTPMAFLRCKLQGADFSNAELVGSLFLESILAGAAFVGAELSNVDFSKADLRSTDFTSAKFKAMTFDGAVYDEKTRFPNGFKPPKSLKWKGKGLAPLVYRAGKAQPEIEAARKPLEPIDFDTLLGRLRKGSDTGKLAKALSMLKSDHFQLFSEVTDQSVVGIVKSQTDPDLIYSCKLGQDGTYACCTQNLNVCGGLRGGLCKHLLVLTIGLAKGGQIAPELVDAWAAASRRRAPDLDKNAMGEVLLRYKGAEAGEVDWRPTETLPEDYHAL